MEGAERGEEPAATAAEVPMEAEGPPASEQAAPTSSGEDAAPATATAAAVGGAGP